LPFFGIGYYPKRSFLQTLGAPRESFDDSYLTIRIASSKLAGYCLAKLLETNFNKELYIIIIAYFYLSVNSSLPDQNSFCGFYTGRVFLATYGAVLSLCVLVLLIGPITLMKRISMTGEHVFVLIILLLGPVIGARFGFRLAKRGALPYWWIMAMLLVPVLYLFTIYIFAG